jgi:hypothetical protein
MGSWCAHGEALCREQSPGHEVAVSPGSQKKSPHVLQVPQSWGHRRQVSRWVLQMPSPQWGAAGSQVVPGGHEGVQ